MKVRAALAKDVSRIEFYSTKVHQAFEKERAEQQPSSMQLRTNSVVFKRLGLSDLFVVCIQNYPLKCAAWQKPLTTVSIHLTPIQKESPHHTHLVSNFPLTDPLM